MTSPASSSTTSSAARPSPAYSPEDIDVLEDLEVPADSICALDIISCADVVIDLDNYVRIYRIDIAFKPYVGRCSLVAGRDIDDRLHEHVQCARLGYGGAPLLRAAMLEHSDSPFVIESLEMCHKDDAKLREIHWINALGSVHPAGYNLMGGDGHGYLHHEETKKKIGESRRGFHKKEWEVRPASRACIQHVTTKKQQGYRGFHQGVPHEFMSGVYTMEEKKLLALEWHFLGTTRYPSRLLRARIHADPAGRQLPAGVKYDAANSPKAPYRAYHPSRQSVLRSPYFETLEKAADYVKLLTSFAVDATPAEYFAKKKEPANEKDPFLLYIKPRKHSKGTSMVAPGTLIGYEVDVPAKKTVSKKEAYKPFMETKFAVEVNLASALAYRAEHILPSELPPTPDWVADLPPPQEGPNMSCIWAKRRDGVVYGYEVKIPAASSLTGTEVYESCLKTSITVEENLASAFGVRAASIKSGIIQGDVPAGEIHPVYLEERHDYLWAAKSKATKKVAKGTVTGWDVKIPAQLSKSGVPVSRPFRKKSVAESLAEAQAYRTEHLKAEVKLKRF